MCRRKLYTARLMKFLESKLFPSLLVQWQDHPLPAFYLVGWNLSTKVEVTSTYFVTKAQEVINNKETFNVSSCPHSVRINIPWVLNTTSYAIPFFTPGRTFFNATFLFNTRYLQWSRCFSFSSALLALYVYKHMVSSGEERVAYVSHSVTHQYKDRDAGTTQTNRFL